MNFNFLLGSNTLFDKEFLHQFFIVTRQLNIGFIISGRSLDGTRALPLPSHVLDQFWKVDVFWEARDDGVTFPDSSLLILNMNHQRCSSFFRFFTLSGNVGGSLILIKHVLDQIVL